MTGISIEKHALKFNGSGYFMDNAQLVKLGTHGEKAGLIGSVGKLEPKGQLAQDRFEDKIRSAGPYLLDTASTTKADFTGSVAANLVVAGFSGSTSAMYDAFKVGHLKFVQLYVLETPMVDAVNGAPKARDAIHGYGSDGRIVHSIIIALEASLAEGLTASASVNASVDVGGILSVSIGGGVGGGQVQKIVLPPQATLAYGLLKLEWSSRDDRFNGSHVDESGLL